MLRSPVGLATLMLGIFPISPAAAGPVYLNCSVTSEEGKTTHQALTLNEDTGTAGIVVKETGASDQRLPAVFAPDSVSFSVPLGQYGEIRYVVDRVNLTFSRTASVGQTAFTDRGACEVAPALKRAF